MKIDTGIPGQPKARQMYFSDLDIGDLFQTVNGTLYVRTNSISDEWEGYRYNAVELADGTLHYFDGDEEVAKYVEYIKLNPKAFVNEVPTD